MPDPTTLPALESNYPDAWEVCCELRVLHVTAKAFKVAAPFMGPTSAAGPTTWLPASVVHRHGPGHAKYFGCEAFSMKARVYRRMAAEINAAARPPVAASA